MRPPSVRSARATHQQANEQVAHIVLQDVAKYGGEGAGLVQWARMIQANSIRQIKGPLFKAA
jgi:hypothetical protein